MWLKGSVLHLRWAKGNLSMGNIGSDATWYTLDGNPTGKSKENNCFIVFVRNAFADKLVFIARTFFVRNWWEWVFIGVETWNKFLNLCLFPILPIHCYSDNSLICINCPKSWPHNSHSSPFLFVFFNCQSLVSHFSAASFCHSRPFFVPLPIHNCDNPVIFVDCANHRSFLRPCL